MEPIVDNQFSTSFVDMLKISKMVENFLSSVTHVELVERERQLRHYRHVAQHGSRPSDSFLSRSEGLDHAEGASTGFMVASGGVLSEGYGHGGLASAWAMARRRPTEYRRWTQRRAAPAYAPISDLMLPMLTMKTGPSRHVYRSRHQDGYYGCWPRKSTLSWY